LHLSSFSQFLRKKHRESEKSAEISWAFVTTRSSAIAEGCATRLSVEILQLQNIPFENDCNLTNHFEVYTPKAIAAFT